MYKLNNILNFMITSAEEALIYFGGMCLFLPVSDKGIQIKWFLISIALVLLRKILKNKWKKKSIAS